MKLKSNLNEKRNVYYVQEGKFVILSYCNKKIVSGEEKCQIILVVKKFCGIV